MKKISFGKKTVIAAASALVMLGITLRAKKKKKEK
jgi:hypothetical protein